jgi:hypothetical protein
LISGNYHNGILTLLIPFGIFGLAAFLWFCWSAMRLLINNYRYGDPAIRNFNAFLLAYFAARLTFYLTLYGQFDLDFVHFTGLVGLSIALNNGMRTSPAVEEEPVIEPEFNSGRRAVAF